jgi:hypothetical protein
MLVGSDFMDLPPSDSFNSSGDNTRILAIEKNRQEQRKLNCLLSGYLCLLDDQHNYPSRRTQHLVEVIHSSSPRPQELQHH